MTNDVQARRSKDIMSTRHNKSGLHRIITAVLVCLFLFNQLLPLSHAFDALSALVGSRDVYSAMGRKMAEDWEEKNSDDDAADPKSVAPYRYGDAYSTSKMDLLFRTLNRINPYFPSFYGNEKLRPTFMPHKRKPEIVFIPTGKCQFSCEKCFFKDILNYCRKENGTHFDLSSKEAAQIAEHFKGYKKIVLGGEPFAWRSNGTSHFQDFIVSEHTSAEDQKIEVFTNGLKLVQEKDLEQYIYRLLTGEHDKVTLEKIKRNILENDYLPTLKITVSLDEGHRKAMRETLRMSGRARIADVYDKLIKRLIRLEKQGLMELNFNIVHHDFDPRQGNDPEWIIDWLKRNFGETVAKMFELEANEISGNRLDEFEHFDMNTSVGDDAGYNSEGFVTPFGHIVFMRDYRAGHVDGGILIMNRLYPPFNIPDACIMGKVYPDKEGRIKGEDIYNVLFEGYAGKIFNFQQYPFMRPLLKSFMVEQMYQKDAKKGYMKEAEDLYNQYKKKTKKRVIIFEKLIKEKDEALVFEWLRAFASCETLLSWDKGQGEEWLKTRAKELKILTSDDEECWDLYNQPMAAQKIVLTDIMKAKPAVKDKLVTRFAGDLALMVKNKDIPYSYKDGDNLLFNIDTGFGIIGDDSDNHDFTRSRVTTERDARIYLDFIYGNVDVKIFNMKKQRLTDITDVELEKAKE